MSLGKDFTIDFVVDRDLIAHGFQKYKGPRDSYYIDCPFCGKKRKVGISSQRGLGKCNYCGEGFNKISLHAKLRGITNLEAGRELNDIFKGLSAEDRELYLKKTCDRENYQEPAPIEIRDTVYRGLLSLLSLSEEHEQDLKKRGLTEKQIHECMYKTFPSVKRAEIGRKLRDFIPYDMPHGYGIPGLYDLFAEDGPKLVKRKNGYLIPVRNDTGKISALQIRFDVLPEDASDEERERFKKYAWLSSSEKKTGCSVSGCENIHFAGDWRSIPETVVITEGALKADVAAALSRKHTGFLGLTGVNNLSQLPGVMAWLKQYDAVKRIFIAVDMDCREKKEVGKALRAIEDIVRSSGLPYEIAEWDGRYKGIDDFMLTNRNFRELMYKQE